MLVSINQSFLHLVHVYIRTIINTCGLLFCLLHIYIHVYINTNYQMLKFLIFHTTFAMIHINLFKKVYIFDLFYCFLRKTWLDMLFNFARPMKLWWHRENVCINMYESIWNRTVGSPVEHGDADSSTDRWLWRSVSPGSRLFFLGVCNSGRSDPDGGAVRLPPHPASPLVWPITMLLYHIYLLISLSQYCYFTESNLISYGSPQCGFLNQYRYSL